MTASLSFAQLTDKGLVRENNEDAMTILASQGPESQKQKGMLFVIADGLGGLAHGEVASKKAVETLSQYFEKSAPVQKKAWLKDAVLLANDCIYQINQKSLAAEAMATTLTASLFFNRHLYIGHVGDCRVLQIRDREYRWLTQDHNIEPHILSRAVGLEAKLAVDLHEIELVVGDRYLQCSDGLYGMVSDLEIFDTVTSFAPEVACQRLVYLANQNGGVDNITVQVIHVDKFNT